jgi:YegS/Rv2252/BmrU family lipid kinase
MKLKLIINPVAEKGRAEKTCHNKITSFFKENHVEFEIESTVGIGDGTRLGRKAVEEGFDTIVTIGGDGTANEVINGIVGSNVTFGIIPCGEGNDFAKMIGVSRRNLKAACQTILDGYTKTIDLGMVNGRYFYNTFGVGFDAEVAEKKEKSFRFLRGYYAYLLQVIPHIFTYRPKLVKISMDGINMESKILFIAVGNGRYTGGGFKTIPLSEIDDGLLDICIIQYPGRLYMLRNLSRVSKGKHLSLPVVFYFKGKEINITATEPLTAHIDGEIFKEPEFNIKLVPQALRMIVRKPE